MTLDVEFTNGESREYTVSPLRAALLGHFGDDDAKTLAELCALTGSSATVPATRAQRPPATARTLPDCLRLAQALRRAMGYWLDEHVVREEGSGDQLRYVVVDDPSAAEAAAAGTGNEAASCPSVGRL